MFKILTQYYEKDTKVTEYTKDGESVSHTVRMQKQTELDEPSEPQPTIEEHILAENQYQTMLLELTNLLGGM